MIPSPRIPRPVTTPLVGIERTVQVNHCRMPDCDNFGVLGMPSQAHPRGGTRTTRWKAPNAVRYLPSVASLAGIIPLSSPMPPLLRKFTD